MVPQRRSMCRDHTSRIGAVRAGDEIVIEPAELVGGRLQRWRASTVFPVFVANVYPAMWRG